MGRGESGGSPAAEARGGLIALGVEMGILAGRFAGVAGLHATDVRALWVLAEAGAPLAVGELGGRLDLSNGAATRVVDRLERAGYVERGRDATDRRRVKVRLTGEVTGTYFGRVASMVEEEI
ncbi:MAG: MarR family transcriptional regulator, partial [Rubrobacteraceae bacterium]